MTRDGRLVYSTDPEENRQCPKCRERLGACRCVAPTPVTGPVSAVLRLEKAGRAGKVVTVLDKLPPNPDYVRGLARRLKAACGCGGSFAIDAGAARIELQGDKREALRPLLAREEIRCKG